MFVSEYCNNAVNLIINYVMLIIHCTYILGKSCSLIDDGRINLFSTTLSAIATFS